MQQCMFIDQWVRDCVEFFFPGGEYEDIRSKMSLSKASCYAVHFPSLWAGDIEELLLSLRDSVESDGVFLIIEISGDSMGNEMCHQADQYQKILNMHCVVNQVPYYGDIEAYKGKTVVMFQFWKRSQSIGLESWIEY